MRSPLKIQSESFNYSFPKSDREVLEMEQFEYLINEINANNPDLIRWIQRSLNKILGLRLKNDGIMGAQTRSAIRTFQQHRGLSVDGVVGPKTESAIKQALSSTLYPVNGNCEVLDRFNFDRDQLQPFHQSQLAKIAARVVASQSTRQPIRQIQLTGHTDVSGEDRYNVGLGQRRADQTRTGLIAVIEQMKPGASRSVIISTTSKGESNPLSKNNSRNRRVEICWDNSVINPPQPKPPQPTSPTVFTPVPVEVPGGGRIQDKRDPVESMLIIVLGVAGRRIKLHKLAGQAWQALVQAARADGIRFPLLLPTSGYRSFQYQEKLWKQALAKYKTPEETRKWVAPPGSSAHQSGRAIDFYLGGKNSSANVAALRKLPAYRWLLVNAIRFGFYPYSREPWHWEYNPLSSGNLTKMTPKQFIEFVGNNAQHSMKQTGVPASVTIAQAILETGWGKHTIGSARNLFGIKGKGPAGTVKAPTKEYINGKWVTVLADFAKYDNFEQSITEHAKFFIRNRRYTVALQFKKNPDRFAREIHKAGYATAPNYSDKLIALMKKYNLYQFDQFSPG